MPIESNQNSYFHKADKKIIPVCAILKVNIAAINMNWLINYISENLPLLSGDYLTVANVHTTVMAFENDSYLKIQNGGIMAIPDGGPLAAEGRKRGFQTMERTTGPSLMEEIFKISIQKKYKHFFYGSTPETLEKMKTNVLKKYPGICIGGMYSPPFRNQTIEEKENDIDIINKAKCDFVWVGLGAPKQEYWMANNQGKIKGFMIGVGAGFDYLAGNIKRAPKLMQKSNLEWLYRLIQNPKLFKRYLSTNFKFIWNAVIKKR